ATTPRAAALASTAATARRARPPGRATSTTSSVVSGPSPTTTTRAAGSGSRVVVVRETAGECVVAAMPPGHTALRYDGSPRREVQSEIPDPPPAEHAVVARQPSRTRHNRMVGVGSGADVRGQVLARERGSGGHEVGRRALEDDATAVVPGTGAE